MTWIKKDIHNAFVNSTIIDNYKQFYQQYNHKLVFYHNKKNIPRSFGRSPFKGLLPDWSDPTLRSVLTESFNDNKISFKVSENFYSIIYYIEDLDSALSAVPRELRKQCKEIFAMDQTTQNFYKHHKSEQYKTVFTVREKLFRNQYRYKINLSSSMKTYRSIDLQQLENANQLLKRYQGLMFSPCFDLTTKKISPHESMYFYAKDLKWLDMFFFTIPNIIQRIEMVKTFKEIKNKETVNES